MKHDNAGIVGRTFHDLRDIRSILDRQCLHLDTRLADFAMDKLDAMIATMRAPADDIAIGAARDDRQANGFTGRKRTASFGRCRGACVP